MPFLVAAWPVYPMPLHGLHYTLPHSLQLMLEYMTNMDSVGIIILTVLPPLASQSRRFCPSVSAGRKMRHMELDSGLQEAFDRFGSG